MDERRGQPSPRRGLVLRNTLWTLLAQLVGTPLSVLVNGAMGRYLGPHDFGDFYLAATFTGFGFLAVEWGQSLALPGLVARDRAKAGELLGTALAWRSCAAVVVYAILAAASIPLGKPREFQVVLLLMVLVSSIGSFGAACQLTAQGFERTDFSAFSAMGLQALNALLVIPTLFFRGKLRAVLIAQAAAGLIVLSTVLRSIRKVGVGALSFRRVTLEALLIEGFPFLFMGLAMTLQPVVDAAFLSKFAAAEAVGWYAASQKLVGLLVFPAAALIGALYPTLCRLHIENQERFSHTARTALRTATILVVPLAVGCFCYPDIGILIFSRDSYGPAEDNLRVASAFVFLVYFTMVIGVCLAAIGRQRAWAVAQCLCVLTSVVLDPILIPWFETRAGNGGLGVCVASIVSEIVMLISGIWLAPRGFFDSGALRNFGTAALAGSAMALVAWLLSDISHFLAAPVAVVAYGGTLWLLGGVDREQIATVQGIIARRR
jgi:O-antigen/teichoic acid export membrane protein